MSSSFSYSRIWGSWNPPLHTLDPLAKNCTTVLTRRSKNGNNYKLLVGLQNFSGRDKKVSFNNYWLNQLKSPYLRKVQWHYISFKI